MDIFKFALDFEKESENYYLKLAKICSFKPVEKILKMLADEEKKHYKIVEKLEKKIKVKKKESLILDDAKSIFKKIKPQAVEELTKTKEFDDILSKAEELEKKSKNFYLEKAESADDEEQKIVFLTLSQEEDKHFNLLRFLREFYMRPKQWVEDAEFNHLDEY